MKILITGVCGFVGSSLAHALLDRDFAHQIIGIDNFSRPGSQLNREPLQKRGVRLIHGDLRTPSDLEAVPTIDWIIDAAANPNVLAGVDGTTSSRQLIEHNLYGTVNMLELAKQQKSGFVLLSTSRVYAIKPLANLPVTTRELGFEPAADADLPSGVSICGIAETFSTEPPVSLYGSSKLASECIALEYGDTFNFPVWINRCGILAGAGQFGRPDQGIFAFWINAYLRRRPLKYIGFNGTGFQTRDCFHPRDLVPLLEKQMTNASTEKPRIVNLGGGPKNTMSLAQLSEWCSDRFGRHPVASELTPRLFDIPWAVMDAGLAQETWKWEPASPLSSILDEIAQHAEQNPAWLEISAAL